MSERTIIRTYEDADLTNVATRIREGCSLGE